MRADGQARKRGKRPPNKAEREKIGLVVLKTANVVGKSGEQEDGKHRVSGMSRRQGGKFVGDDICAKARFDGCSALPPRSEVIGVIHSENKAETRSAHQLFCDADNQESDKADSR